MRFKSLAYIKAVRSRGKLYLYFDTGLRENGKPVYRRLPDKSDLTFGSVYATLLGHRTRRGLDVLTVPKLVALYQASPQFLKLASATQKLYKLYQGKFVEAYDSAPANEIERKDLIRIFDKMAATPGAANMMLASVGALYRWGRRGSLVTNRPTDDIDVNELGEHEPWPDDLLDDALACDAPIVRLGVHLLYFTAQRILDVVNMRWDQVSDDSVTVIQVKTRKELTIALHPALSRALAPLDRSSKRILVDAKGRSFTTDRLRAVVQKWAAVRGHKVVPHGLRKNAVNALLECGCTVAETAAISGQTLQMVEHYAKKRDQTKLARVAMGKWGRTDSETANQLENIPER